MPRKSTALAGHALVDEGRVHNVHGYRHKDGSATCECGAKSVILDSDAARQRWHRSVHKPAMRALIEKEGT